MTAPKYSRATLIVANFIQRRQLRELENRQEMESRDKQDLTPPTASQMQAEALHERQRGWWDDF